MTNEDAFEVLSYVEYGKRIANNDYTIPIKVSIDAVRTKEWIERFELARFRIKKNGWRVGVQKIVASDEEEAVGRVEHSGGQVGQKVFKEAA